jgi:hypothetical protein
MLRKRKMNGTWKRRSKRAYDIKKELETARARAETSDGDSYPKINPSLGEKEAGREGSRSRGVIVGDTKSRQC